MIMHIAPYLLPMLISTLGLACAWNLIRVVCDAMDPVPHKHCDRQAETMVNYTA